MSLIIRSGRCFSLRQNMQNRTLSFIWNAKLRWHTTCSKVKDTKMDGNMLGTLRVTDPTELSLISRASSDEVESITIPMLMKRTVESYGSYPALRYKSDGLEGWNTINYKEYRDRVEKMSKVFIKLGLERHGAVAVLAFNSVEWFVSELAAIHAGGIIAGIYTTNSVEACLHILKTSKANIVIVDDVKQMEKICAIRHKLPLDLMTRLQVHY